MTTVQRATFDDLMDTLDDGYRYELVRGEILRMPPPQGIHVQIEFRLARMIERFLAQRAQAFGWDETQDEDAYEHLVGLVAGGEGGVRFSVAGDSDQVRGMDLCYLNPEQVARYRDAGGTGYFREVPALVVEVLSPSDSASYLDEKVLDYLAGGARLVWLLDPRRRIVRVFRPNGTNETVPAGDALSGEEVLPGFTVPVARLFPSPAADKAKV